MPSPWRGTVTLTAAVNRRPVLTAVLRPCRLGLFRRGKRAVARLPAVSLPGVPGFLLHVPVRLVRLAVVARLPVVVYVSHGAPSAPAAAAASGTACPQVGHFPRIISAARRKVSVSVSPRSSACLRSAATTSPSSRNDVISLSATEITVLRSAAPGGPEAAAAVLPMVSRVSLRLPGVCRVPFPDLAERAENG